MSKVSLIAVAFVAVLSLVISGCNTEREANEQRAILKAGQQVGADMVGWVAVPNTAPKLAEGNSVKYAVVSAQNVVPSTMNGWVAMPGSLFNKMAGVKVDAPAGGSAEKWLLKPEGRSVPKDKHGWVAVPPSSPEVENAGGGLEMAKLYSGNIVPKELNGWVAVDAETLAKLTERIMNTGPGSKVSKDK